MLVTHLHGHNLDVVITNNFSHQNLISLFCFDDTTAYICTALHQSFDPTQTCDSYSSHFSGASPGQSHFPLSPGEMQWSIITTLPLLHNC